MNLCAVFDLIEISEEDDLIIGRDLSDLHEVTTLISFVSGEFIFLEILQASYSCTSSCSEYTNGVYLYTDS